MKNDHSFANIFFVFHFFAKTMLEFLENVTFFRIVSKSNNYNYHSRRKVLFSLHRKWWANFQRPGPWGLSIVSQAGFISFDVWLRKRNARDDEKELKKANLHASSGVVVNFGSGNVLLKPLVMPWIMKHSLLGKFTVYWHFIEHNCAINSLAINVVLTYLIVTWLDSLVIWDYLIYVHLYEKYLQQRASFK